MMRAMNALSLPLLLLASLQLPKATNSWSLSVTGSVARPRKSTAFSPQRCPHLTAPTVSFAAKHSETEVSRKKKKKSKKGEDEESVEIRNHRNYGRIEAFFASEIGLTDQTHVKRIVERAPTMLCCAETNLREKINLFRGHFDYSNEELRKIIRKEPCTIQYSIQNLEAKLMNISHLLFDGDMSSAGIILKKQPSVLNLDIEKTLMPKVNYLRDEVFQGNVEAVQEFMLKYPVILASSLNSRIIPRVQALRTQGFNPSDAIGSWSRMTNEKFEHWFKKKTGVPLPDGWCPPTRGRQEALTFEQKVQKRIEILSTELSLEREEAHNLMKRNPGIKQLGINSLKKKLKYLVGLFGGSKDEASGMILKHPMLLSSSVEYTLKPAVAYLRQTVFLGNEQDLIDTITKYPALVGLYSLENRIKPRVEATITAGLNPADLNVGSMIQTTDKEFPLWLKRQQQNFLSKPN